MQWTGPASRGLVNPESVSAVSVIERWSIMQQERRTPSNRMPPYEPPRTPLRAILVLATIFITIMWVSGGFFLAVYVAAGLLLAPPLLFLRRRVRSRRWTEGRQSICRFARSFDCRTTDTWIIRAVFEVIRQRRTVPFAAGTRLEEDLALDPEDLEELTLIVCQRTGRPFDPVHSPLFTGNTVGELVAWFQLHPPRPRRAA